MLHFEFIAVIPENDKRKEDLVNILRALQNPLSSQWKRPFIRVISNHEYNQKAEVLTVYAYVYFTRLIFELIADPAVKV